MCETRITSVHADEHETEKKKKKKKKQKKKQDINHLNHMKLIHLSFNTDENA